MTLRLRDTLSGTRKEVRPRRGRPIGLYVCGPTVYAPAHVGHARTYIEFDLIRRGLETDGTPVHHVMNVTDFEDKIDVRANELGVTWRALARREEASFFRDLDALHVRRPHDRPRASSFVPEMIAIGRRLERTGRVVQRGDERIYHPPRRPRGANFATGEELAARAVREPEHPFPIHDQDAEAFTVWKRQEPPHPSWRSPWGPGTPGWHLECYAMAERYLGIPADVHGGGRDLIFSHHFAENEIALTLAHQPFSRIFVHTAFVLQNGVKMSKSTGDLVTIRSALEVGSAGSLRWYVLRLPYTERIEWDDRSFLAAGREYDGVRAAFRGWTQPGGGGRFGEHAARALAEGVRRDLAANLGTGHAIERLRRFAARLGSDPTARVARGERGSVRAAIRSIEDRTGLPLL